MTHAFLLMVYLCQKVLSQVMYFYDLDKCYYFAERMTNQPAVPNRTAGEGVPKSRKYVAVCEPRLVDSAKTKIY